MGPYNCNQFSDAPAMVLPPQQAQPYTMSDQLEPSPSQPMTLNTTASSSSYVQPSPTSYVNHCTSWTPTESIRTITTNPSRKRSRDENVYEPEADGSYFSAQQVRTPAPIPEEEPIYGEGMTLLNPKTGVSISAESQTGTWYEEKVETERAAPAIAPSEIRPEMPKARKSQRLDLSAPGLDDLAQSVLPASPPKTGVTEEPTVDDFTHQLGIGWTRVASDDADAQAAIRGWARYIDNHFSSHVHGSQILLKSKGLNAYLVGAQEGFFLFSEDLLEGRFIGPSWDVCLVHLQSVPMTFEGIETLKAERTPAPDGVVEAAMANGINGLHDLANDHGMPNGYGQEAVMGMEID